MLKRRGFIKKSTLTSFAALIGTDIVFGKNLLADYYPIVLQEGDPAKLFGKHKEMSVLNDRPWNIEAKAHLLDDAVTPEASMFIRNNGLIPEKVDIANWKLKIDGESVAQPKEYSLKDLKSKFKTYTYQLTLECGGNGRSEFNPPAKGNQWTIGAVSCSNWTGVRLRDVLEDIGIKDDAVYVAYYGNDQHLSGDTSKVVISRGVPLSKAMMDETLIAFEMNGEDIPLAHGYPVRLVEAGQPPAT
ncbi:MAG: molybdopterin-dependent oxidoreductase, partial [Bacteroidota bacterium]